MYAEYRDKNLSPLRACVLFPSRLQHLLSLRQHGNYLLDLEISKDLQRWSSRRSISSSCNICHLPQRKDQLVWTADVQLPSALQRGSKAQHEGLGEGGVGSLCPLPQFASLQEQSRDQQIPALPGWPLSQCHRHLTATIIKAKSANPGSARVEKQQLED